MGEVIKKPIVIRDLIELASYTGENNLDVSDRFLFAAETTFKQLGEFPFLGKLSQFDHPKLIHIRQIAIKGFPKYLIFYRTLENGVEILRVIYGQREIQTILEADLE
jgi:toxin ParE1/3/4